MKFKNYLLLVLFLLNGFSNYGQQHTYKKDINDSWFFKLGNDSNALSSPISESNWSEVTLPHTFNPSGTSEIYREHGKEVMYAGDAWYKRKLFIEDNLKNKRIFLRFDGAYITTDVFINGKKVGYHKGGYSAFIFEITNKVNYGKENTISVKVNNEHTNEITPLGGGYIKFGGITRPVWLEVKDKVCISPLHYASTGVYCKQLNVNSSKADLEIEVRLDALKGVKGKYKVVCSILDGNNERVAKKDFKGTVSKNNWKVNIPMTVKKPILWHGKENPALYKVRTELYLGKKLVDVVIETTGFRTVAVEKNKGFYLNGKSYPLYGAALHQYYPGVGSAMLKEHFEADNALMHDIGLTSVRLSHYPHSKYRYELADKTGIVLYTELAMIKQFYESEAFQTNCKDQMNEMVYQLYNHPSIAIWGLFNEIRYDVFQGFNVAPLLEDLNTIAKEADPSRLTCGVSWLEGKRNNVADLSGWNRYQGWYWNAYEGGPEDFSWLDDKKKNEPNLDYAITEYGAGGAINHFDENRKVAPYNQDQFHPVDFYNYSHEKHLVEIKKRPWLWGSYVWTLVEFLATKYDQGRVPLLHDKGLVAEGRDERKDSYYLYKANWNKEPMLHLAYKQFNMRILDHAEITVYSNLAEVELEVNGMSYGTLKNASDAIYRWNNIPLKKGDNTVKVSSVLNGKTYKEEAVWHYIENIHQDAKIEEIVASSQKWSAFFDTKKEETKSGKGTGVPGEEINSVFKASEKFWKEAKDWPTIQLPLKTSTRTALEGNWEGETLYLHKEFEIKEGELDNPHLYLRHTARFSKRNPGRISVAIDGKNILVLEEGFDDYRLIPVNERLGNLSGGKHTMTIIANKPSGAKVSKTFLGAGILDIGLINIKK